MPNNSECAEWAVCGLEAFATETGQLEGGDWEHDYENVIADFLCDLMHHCEAEKIDFDKLLERARNHFHCEGGDGHPKDDIAEMEDGDADV